MAALIGHSEASIYRYSIDRNQWTYIEVLVELANLYNEAWGIISYQFSNNKIWCLVGNTNEQTNELLLKLITINSNNKIDFISDSFSNNTILASSYIIVNDKLWYMKRDDSEPNLKKRTQLIEMDPQSTEETIHYLTEFDTVDRNITWLTITHDDTYIYILDSYIQDSGFGTYKSFLTIRKYNFLTQELVKIDTNIEVLQYGFNDPNLFGVHVPNFTYIDNFLYIDGMTFGLIGYGLFSGLTKISLNGVVDGNINPSPMEYKFGSLPSYYGTYYDYLNEYFVGIAYIGYGIERLRGIYNQDTGEYFGLVFGKPNSIIENNDTAFTDNTLHSPYGNVSAIAVHDSTIWSIQVNRESYNSDYMLKLYSVDISFNENGEISNRVENYKGIIPLSPTDQGYINLLPGDITPPVNLSVIPWLDSIGWSVGMITVS